MTDHRQHDNRSTRAEKATPSNDSGKPPPHNLEAEEALIGAALLTPVALEVLATKTQPEDYYRPAHATIVRQMIRLFEKGDPVDVTIVADSLKRNDELEGIGGPSTLVTMLANVPSTANAPKYAEIIHNDATLRRLMNASSAVNDLARSRPFDVHEAVEAAQSAIAAVASQNGARSYSNLRVPDMAALVAGDVVLEEPTLLSRSDGKCLFYAGKMHVLQAEPSTGKTWIALMAAIEVLNQGGAVVFIDYEDSERGIWSRLLALGATPDVVGERFQYVQPDGSMGSTERAELLAVFARLNPDLVIIDGVGEALARDGFDEDKNTDVIKWTDTYPRWVARTGAAVVMLDHVTKDKEKRSRFARGASAKLAVVDGAAYSVTLVSGFSRHRSGQVKLTIAKDRPGAVGEIKATAALVKIEPSGNGEVVRVTVEPTPDPISPSDSWKPTRIMERLSLEVEESKGPLTSKLLVDLVAATSKPPLVKDAFSRLIAEGFFTTYKVGPTTYVRSIKAYRQGMSPVPSVEFQQSLSQAWEEHTDELAARRVKKGKNHDHRDPTDPGPTEPND